MSEDFRIFSSVRFDTTLKVVPDSSLEHAGWNYRHASPFYMLDLHRDRLLRAATHWQWHRVIEVLAGDQGLGRLAGLAETFVGPSQATPLRLTIFCSQDGSISFERSETPPISLANLFPRTLPAPGSQPSRGEPADSPRYSLVLDDGVLARSEYTHFKTTKREMYNVARKRAGIMPTDKKDILLINQNDRTVMEGSITTPYFWRGGRWVTPPVARFFSREEGSGGQDGTSRRWALERGLVVEEAVNADSVTHGEECWISNGTRGFVAAVVISGSETGREG